MDYSFTLRAWNLITHVDYSLYVIHIVLQPASFPLWVEKLMQISDLPKFIKLISSKWDSNPGILTPLTTSLQVKCSAWGLHPKVWVKFVEDDKCLKYVTHLFLMSPLK